MGLPWGCKSRSPSSALSHPFVGGGFPTKIDYRKKGTLFLTSLLVDLEVSVGVSFFLDESKIGFGGPFGKFKPQKVGTKGTTVVCEFLLVGTNKQLKGQPLWGESPF